MKKSPSGRLIRLLKEANAKVSFDPYRDSTKGCGKHCRAWATSVSDTYCENHMAAILRGDYLVPCGIVEEAMISLREEIATLKRPKAVD